MSSYVGVLVADQPQGALAVVGLSDDVDVRLQAQEHGQPSAHQGLVVHDADSDHRPSSKGRWARTA